MLDLGLNDLPCEVELQLLNTRGLPGRIPSRLAGKGNRYTTMAIPKGFSIRDGSLVT